MEAVVVDAVRPGDRQYPQPSGLVHGRVTGQGEEAAIVFAAQEDASAVDGQTVPLLRKVAHTEVGRPPIIIPLSARRCFEIETQAEHRRLELIPEGHIVAGIISELDDVRAIRDRDLD